jgi:hypothetical protein
MMLPWLMAILVAAGALVALWSQRPLRATAGIVTTAVGVAGLLATTPGTDPLLAGLWLVLGAGVLGSIAWATASTVQRAEEERGQRRTRWYKALLLLPLPSLALLLHEAWQQAPIERFGAGVFTAPEVLWPLVPAIVGAALAPLWWARAQASEVG